MRIPQSPPNPNTPSADVATQQWVNTYFQRAGNPSVTAGPLSSGPPGGVGNGGIWIATNVDPNGAVWQFRYNANSSSAYKWEFIGGGRPQGTGAGPANVGSLSQVGSTGWWYAPGVGITVARAGDYQAWLTGTASSNGVSVGDAQAAIADVSVASPITMFQLSRQDFVVASGGSFVPFATQGNLTGITAGHQVNAVWSGSSVTFNVQNVTLQLAPIRIS